MGIINNKSHLESKMQLANLGKKIDIITVTYNSSEHIINLLTSIENSNDSKIIRKVFVIENNSPDKDKTEAKILLYKKSSKLKIQFIKSSHNNGFAKSCNLGAKKARAKYLLFVNPDTEVLENSIKTLLLHTMVKEADISGGKSINYRNIRHLTVVREPNLNIGLFEFSNLGKLFHTERGHNDFYYLNQSNILLDKVDVEVDALGGAYLLVKTTSFIRLNGFDEKFFMYLEDVDFSIRAKKFSMKVIYCPHSVIKHVGGASSQNKYKIRHKAWFDSRKYYYWKHHGILTNIILQPLYTLEEIVLKIVRKV